ncbi:D-alanyl-lipoteichoic acid biosynthesis protein DltD [Bombilactobacillus bombi]|uniref:D-alanyl-lipoteichoic acid biosynthesis protein DltD n=1 Tax=Bombilactobacillus bombi TaxID=1303590 RepID=UPI0015E60A1E|nr:D-alanyl-lipoteichoic acid biosynthesis protein DltD [Bombilactobacillus bombi]MBA1434509.1 D-alanyl-lipoteichoic acid biosynthesis protein DltD [Bombilactobacillus bombi]
MNNLKKLGKIIAPMILAAVLAIALLYGPWHFPASSQTVKKASTSLTANVLRGDQIKDKALDDGYLMMMGSSELSRFDSFHPSVLSQKYHRGYKPFLLGSPGTQSLTHFFSTEAMGKHLDNKRVVVFISPQWFVKEGVDPRMFGSYYSKQQATYFINHANPNSLADRYAARRLLAMPSGKSDTDIENSLKAIADKRAISGWDKFTVGKLGSVNLRHQDQIFTRLFIDNREQLIDNRTRVLPDHYDYQRLDQLAFDLGKEHTTNNEFGIENKFYQRKLKRYVKGLKNSQTHFTYEYGPEFSDFQLLLNQFQRHHVTPLFVITPVNGAWMDYTGLHQSMLDRFDRKIKYQLQSQGFNNIVDLHRDGRIPFFMQDTIHIGWRGWLRVDRHIHHFVQQPLKQPNYQMNDYFYTKKWQKRNPQTLP